MARAATEPEHAGSGRSEADGIVPSVGSLAARADDTGFTEETLLDCMASTSYCCRSCFVGAVLNAFGGGDGGHDLLRRVVRAFGLRDDNLHEAHRRGRLSHGLNLVSGCVVTFGLRLAGFDGGCALRHRSHPRSDAG